MPYCSKQDLIDRFGNDELVQLTDDANTGVINDVVLNQAISDASAEMDGYLASRYQLPLANQPQVLKPLACNITRYLLHDESAGDQVTKRYDAAIKSLVNISKGIISLGLTDTGTTAQSNDLVEMQSAGSVFARNKSTGFI
jgi:phage gp36-like protein